MGSGFAQQQAPGSSTAPPSRRNRRRLRGKTAGGETGRSSRAGNGDARSDRPGNGRRAPEEKAKDTAPQAKPVAGAVVEKGSTAVKGTEAKPGKSPSAVPASGVKSGKATPAGAPAGTTSDKGASLKPGKDDGSARILPVAPNQPEKKGRHAVGKGHSHHGKVVKTHAATADKGSASGTDVTKGAGATVK